MEYLQVFDKDKNALNKKILREDKFSLKDGDHFMVVIIFIENNEEKFLMQKTSDKRNSCIAATGGHVSFKDDGFKTVIKEVKEELGLDLLKNEVEYVDTFDYGNGFVELYYAKKNVDIDSLILQKDEVEYVKWYTKDEIEELIKENKIREGNIKPFLKILEYRGMNDKNEYLDYTR